ncbi:MAG: SH3 domain-containing protein [Sulfolobales archaeon]|nr:SH3 domain-containing protein [Sulfolobales archaeon]
MSHVRRCELMNKQLVEKANKMVQGQPTKPTEPTQKYADFKEEIKARDVVITLHNGTVLKCKIIDVRPYWLKVHTQDGVTLYVNKAYITLIKPAGGER